VWGQFKKYIDYMAGWLRKWTSTILVLCVQCASNRWAVSSISRQSDRHSVKLHRARSVRSFYGRLWFLWVRDGPARMVGIVTFYQCCRPYDFKIDHPFSSHPSPIAQSTYLHYGLSADCQNRVHSTEWKVFFRGQELINTQRHSSI